MKPFSPIGAATVHITTSSSTGNVQVYDGTNNSVRIVNSGTAVAFVEFGPDDTITTSATTGMPIVGGASVVIATNSPWVAAIAPTGTPAIYFTPGNGGI